MELFRNGHLSMDIFIYISWNLIMTWWKFSQNSDSAGGSLSSSGTLSSTSDNSSVNEDDGAGRSGISKISDY